MAKPKKTHAINGVEYEIVQRQDTRLRLWHGTSSFWYDTKLGCKVEWEGTGFVKARGAIPGQPNVGTKPVKREEVVARVAELEAQVEALKIEVGALRTRLAALEPPT